ncbi:hypothetical protein HV824_33970 [Myxococcus sp. AM009]|uniref:hypothetical protein n=1 Tax=unclassified Myxococcus TaxID=2648731 RepID=UPI0015956B59|nr:MULTISPECIES: hypothetical protein [unclassified Myxococcus]NVJ03092.1 hypothetical protein [Myxococcus sp. AM009]NVJ19436.1 hypothetical protein [Myxococcus sp. AM010]
MVTLSRGLLQSACRCLAVAILEFDAHGAASELLRSDEGGAGSSTRPPSGHERSINRPSRETGFSVGWLRCCGGTGAWPARTAPHAIAHQWTALRPGGVEYHLVVGA